MYARFRTASAQPYTQPPGIQTAPGSFRPEISRTCSLRFFARTSHGCARVEDRRRRASSPFEGRRPIGTVAEIVQCGEPFLPLRVGMAPPAVLGERGLAALGASGSESSLRSLFFNDLRTTDPSSGSTLPFFEPCKPYFPRFWIQRRARPRFFAFRVDMRPSRVRFLRYRFSRKL